LCVQRRLAHEDAQNQRGDGPTGNAEDAHGSSI
jgi:hypothetical protein